MLAAGGAFRLAQLLPVDLARGNEVHFIGDLVETLALVVANRQAVEIGQLIVGQVAEVSGTSW
mgnify:CR=1 FL=1